MNHYRHSTVVLLALTLGYISAATPASAQPADAPAEKVSLAEGKLQMPAPKDWVRKQPRTRIVEHEFAVPSEGDAEDGRVTIMGAGGSVEANIDRWAAQFEDAAGGTPDPKVEKKQVAGMDVHVVDLAGTYKDMPGGPFAGGKPVYRENYRMLAAIVVSGDQNIGNYFIKFYGPKATVDAQAAAFQKSIEAIEKK